MQVGTKVCYVEQLPTKSTKVLNWTGVVNAVVSVRDNQVPNWYRVAWDSGSQSWEHKTNLAEI